MLPLKDEFKYYSSGIALESKFLLYKIIIFSKMEIFFYVEVEVVDYAMRFK